jgi:predicted secreted Zn-dependent protease
MSLQLTDATASETTDLTYDYYEVKGDNYPSLMASLNKFGPGKFHAQTNWHVSWHFKYQRSANACALRDIRVKKTIAIIFPYWINKPNDETPLTREWKRYIKALKRHELVHVSYVNQIQSDIQMALSKLPAMDNCHEMGDTAHKKGHEILLFYKTKNLEHDVNTQHGKTEEAEFRQPSVN